MTITCLMLINYYRNAVTTRTSSMMHARLHWRVNTPRLEFGPIG